VRTLRSFTLVNDACRPVGRAGHGPFGRAVWSTGRVRLTNDCYLITLKFQSGVERYFKDDDHWTKLTARGRRMPATAEQVLNHLLPALAGTKPGITVQVDHRDLDESAAQLLDRLRA
jgi:hypothetical protein